MISIHILYEHYHHNHCRGLTLSNYHLVVGIFVFFIILIGIVFHDTLQLLEDDTTIVVEDYFPEVRASEPVSE